jgi:membrane associated rhomboid family serine protease
MFIPLNTDAPLYHFPWGTIGLIVINTLCFALTGFGFDATATDFWVLEYGNGINPLEWFTAAFAHADFIHLIGNMFFLWGFGLVTEGKLGWRRFLLIYLLLIAAWGAAVDLSTLHRSTDYVLKELGVQSFDEFVDKLIEQDVPLRERLVTLGISGQLLQAGDENPDLWPVLAITTLNSLQGACLGASGVIFSLMGMALIWAPKNELQIVGLPVFRAISFDISILMFSGLKIGWDLIAWLLHPVVDSPALNLIGLAPGLIVGTVMLKRGWVDCENWDLFSVLSGNYGRFADSSWQVGTHSAHLQQTYGDLPLPAAAGTDELPAFAPKPTRNKVPASVIALIDKGDFLTAADQLFELRLQNSELCPDEEHTRKLAIGLCRADAWDHAEIWLTESITRFPEDNRWARIRLAQLLVDQSRPRAAIKQLQGMSTQGINPELLAQAKRIAKQARELLRQGVEDADTDWT